MKDDRPTCCTYRVPPLRPELQAAYDDMDAKGGYFATAVCRTYDGQAWEVNTRQGSISTALDGRYTGHDEAMAAGAAWLQGQVEREPDADELAFRALWEEHGPY
ncbi:hypothetical protein RGU70_17530 [Herbaspirillum sp. RTI4]|uniref:hypothetical protein n=1 Tax=Herbaspirillum sp. RTI4 TaxID=3048640 RepID=UPI002AB37490|nr:hypothetical protein [Herbaspirillum sp. RTI4]MDY7580114.1 hypothetical protein [Herbaspirillum sp. RTI4]MEA9983267.1 hypothetical protein [Herbaspirillum sp. RTI4]